LVIHFFVLSSIGFAVQEDDSKRSRNEIREAINIQCKPLYVQLESLMVKHKYTEALRVIDAIEDVHGKYGSSYHGDLEIKMDALFGLKRFGDVVKIYRGSKNIVGNKSLITYLFALWELGKTSDLRGEVTKQMFLALSHQETDQFWKVPRSGEEWRGFLHFSQAAEDFSHGKSAEALRNFLIAKKFLPGNPVVDFQVGRAYADLKCFEQAIKQYRSLEGRLPKTMYEGFLSVSEQELARKKRGSF
jgi:tetratricopeptide (TPR) repeat protein